MSFFLTTRCGHDFRHKQSSWKGRLSVSIVPQGWRFFKGFRRRGGPYADGWIFVKNGRACVPFSALGVLTLFLLHNRNYELYSRSSVKYNSFFLFLFEMILSNKVAHIDRGNSQKCVNRAVFPLCHLVFSGTDLAHMAHFPALAVCHQAAICVPVAFSHSHKNV